MMSQDEIPRLRRYPSHPPLPPPRPPYVPPVSTIIPHDRIRDIRDHQGMSAQAFAEAICRKLRRQVPGPLPHTRSHTVALAIPARIDGGNWIADCPYCGGAEMLEANRPGLYCLNPWCPRPHGRKWIGVRMPEAAERHEAEKALLGVVMRVRDRRTGKPLLVDGEPLWEPAYDFRFWRPGDETVADLLLRIAAMGEPHHSWVAPRTYTTGELITAAMGNIHWRDNLLALRALPSFAVPTAGTDVTFPGAVYGGAAARMATPGGFCSGNVQVPYDFSITGVYAVIYDDGGGTIDWTCAGGSRKDGQSVISYNDSVTADDHALTQNIADEIDVTAAFDLFEVAKHDILTFKFTLDAITGNAAWLFGLRFEYD